MLDRLWKWLAAGSPPPHQETVPVITVKYMVALQTFDGEAGLEKELDREFFVPRVDDGVCVATVEHAGCSVDIVGTVDDVIVHPMMETSVDVRVGFIAPPETGVGIDDLVGAAVLDGWTLVDEITYYNHRKPVAGGDDDELPVR